MSDISGSINVGGTAQLLCPADNSRNVVGIFNPDPMNTLWVAMNSIEAAPNAQGSFALYPGGSALLEFPHPARTQISIYGARTGQHYTAYTG